MATLQAMLILFDVDATLITTSRAGIVAMERAGREMFGSTFTTERTEFAGRLDPLILADLLRDNAIEVTEANLASMRAGYRRYLEERLQDRSLAKPLPGVMDLLSALEIERGIVLGLLTGNFPDTGQIKLRACGIHPERFAIHVWGDQSPQLPPCRTQLPGVGLARYREQFGPLEASSATIIGDTPHDIGCAKAHGCRSLGVATGPFSAAALAEAGADRVVENLADTRDVLSWLIGIRIQEQR